MPATVFRVLLFNGLSAGVALIVGLIGGWWFFGKHGADDESDKKSSEEKGTAFDAERAVMAAGQIHDLTSRVAQDVGQHSTAIEEFSAEIEAYKRGSQSAESKAIAAAIAKIAHANATLQTELERAEKKLAQQASEIASHQSAALTDSLTGLNNRRAFDEALKQRLAEWKRKNAEFALLIFDVDHFKKFNDTHGHQAGDEVLRFVGRALKDVTREMDIPCRYGGEEFAVILPDTKESEAKIAVERARKAIEAMVIEFEGKQLRVTSSVGMAQVRANDEATKIIRRADDALYAAKEAGRNCGYMNVGEHSVPVANEGNTRAKSSTPLPVLKVLPKLADATAFLGDVTRRIAESQRFAVPLSVVSVHVQQSPTDQVRLDQEWNDVLLDSVAQFLQSTIRDMDLLAYRDNGRFGIMLPGSTFAESEQIANRIVAALSKCVIPVGGTKAKVAVSIGVAESETAQSAEELILLVEEREVASTATPTETPAQK